MNLSQCNGSLICIKSICQLGGIRLLTCCLSNHEQPVPTHSSPSFRSVFADFSTQIVYVYQICTWILFSGPRLSSINFLNLWFLTVHCLERNETHPLSDLTCKVLWPEEPGQPMGTDMAEHACTCYTEIRPMFVCWPCTLDLDTYILGFFAIPWDFL